MQNAFVDDPPSITIKDGLARINIEGHPKDVVVPVHVLRRFCESATRCITAWDREQSGKPNNVIMGCRLCDRRGRDIRVVGENI